MLLPKDKLLKILLLLYGISDSPVHWLNIFGLPSDEFGDAPDMLRLLFTLKAQRLRDFARFARATGR
eukprot:IDg23009t1